MLSVPASLVCQRNRAESRTAAVATTKLEQTAIYPLWMFIDSLPKKRFAARRRRRTVLVIPRKEVIQPHLPIRLPCYDLVPLTGLTFGASLLAVGTTTSGATNSGGLTGGVYKAQEHIHRGVADPRLLAIPASCGRIAAHNLN